MQKLLVIFFLVQFFWVAESQSQQNFEIKMHNIYKQSYSSEISDERWASYLAGVGNRTYRVRPGDTLWDLSVVFFGDGLFWSKIWSYNERLTNPHMLTVGQDIRFFTGSVEEAPGIMMGPEAEAGALVNNSGGEGAEANAGEAPADPSVLSNLPEGFKEVQKMELSDKKESLSADGTVAEESISEKVTEDGGANPTLEEPKPFAAAMVNRSGLYPDAPAIPPPSILVKPVLGVLPRTFTDSQTYDVSQYDEKGISFDLRPPVRVNPLFVANTFLYGRNARYYPHVGRVIESENKTKLVGLNQQIYVKSKEKLEIGERLTVMGKDYSFDRNGIIGDVIQYQGTMEVTEFIRDDLYRGTIIKSLSGIQGNPWLSRESIPTFADDYVGRPSEKVLQIIGGGKDNVTRFYGQSDVVFLKGGTAQGVRVGDILGVYKRRDRRYKETTVDRAPVPIGHIKIFRAEPDVSSAFVISSDDVIVPGDETGAPTMVEAVTTQSEKTDLNDIETGLDFRTDPDPEIESSLEDELETEIE